jgi:acetyl-CoA acetyltransferase
MAEDHTIKDKCAIVGIGETEFTKAGMIQRSEFQLACEAILAAVADAGLSIKDIDGISSYSDDRNVANRIATALGIPHIGFAALVWAGGGGGGSASVGNACAALVAGYSKYVVAFRGLAQGQFGRFGQSRAAGRISGQSAYETPFGAMAPVHRYGALPFKRHMHEYGTTPEQLAHISLACYKHAQQNPRAIMYGRPLDMEKYMSSRYIAEPMHLFDCCLENDGAAAAVITTAERARDLKQRPAYIMAHAQGHGNRFGAGLVRPDFLVSNHNYIAPYLWEMAGIGPKDVDVAQFYENFTTQVLLTIEDYGFCKKGEGGPFIEGGRIEWPDGELPINTSGGNLAEAYIHGFELITEAVRQIRGTSNCQVKDAEISFVASGPGVPQTSSLILRR